MTHWLIYSREHNAWWRANRRGYTNDIDHAGRYSEDEAKMICDAGRWRGGRCRDGGVSEFAIPAPEATTDAVQAERAAYEPLIEACRRLDKKFDDDNCWVDDMRKSLRTIEARKD